MPRLIPVTAKENLENFSSLSIGEVCKIAQESSNASCWLDPVPTWLVKSCFDVLAPSITEMVTLTKIRALIVYFLYTNSVHCMYYINCHHVHF